MKNPAILFLLGWAIAALAVAMVIAAFVAAGFGEARETATFIVSAVITGFLAGGLLSGFRGRALPVSREQSIVLLILIWIVLPIGAAAPFFFGVKDSGLVASIFEAASGLTTTGTTVFEDIAELPRAIVFWRALLQWLGGALTLIVILLILSPSRMLGLTGPSLSPISQIKRRDLAQRVASASKTILPVYSGLTFICVILLWAGGIPGFDAICLGLSTVSTGGFMPRDGTIAQYSSPVAELVLCVFMALGAMSFLAHRAHFTGAGSGHHRYAESRFFLIIILTVTLVLSMLTWAEQSYAVTLLPDALRTGLFRSISLATTTGFDNAPSTSLMAVPFAIVLLVTLVGGCAYSTAGGLKAFRFAMMLNQSRRELARLMHPHSVTTRRSEGGLLSLHTMTAIWVLFAVYISCAVVLSMFLAHDGMSLGASILVAVAALSNAGPAAELGFSGGTEITIADLSKTTLLAYAATMILGRLELLAALSLFAMRVGRLSTRL